MRFHRAPLISVAVIHGFMGFMNLAARGVEHNAWRIQAAVSVLALALALSFSNERKP